MRRALALLAVVVVTGACSGPVLANPPVAHPQSTAAPAMSPRPPDPQPVVLPRDDAPHDRLTEWWYDTGHLVDDTGADGWWGENDCSALPRFAPIWRESSPRGCPGRAMHGNKNGHPVG